MLLSAPEFSYATRNRIRSAAHTTTLLTCKYRSRTATTGAVRAFGSLNLDTYRCKSQSASSRKTNNYSSAFRSIKIQKRWITQNYILRLKDAEVQWKQFAAEIRAGKRKSFVEHLEERGLINQVVGDRDLLHRVFTEKRVGIYAGVDPTAPSLHIGHMLPFMVLAWAYVWGLPAFFLLGGSTARFGDPTGRIKGREEMHSSVRKTNMTSMHMQLKKLGLSVEKYGIRHGYIYQKIWKRCLINNNVWWNSRSFYEILRDFGAHMRLGPMLGRDYVKTRLESGEGMSFAEFTYPIMQAWDWWELFQKGCQVQVGGADQFGNILFGMEAVKIASKNTKIQLKQNDLENDIDKPIGFTVPLLTTASGEKIGKSAGNAIWLDKDMTSSFELYQFLVRTPDADVERYLKLFTFLPLPRISEIMEEQNKDPSKRVAQHTLAAEFLELVHGPTEADAAAMQHRQLFRPRDSTGPPTPLPAKLNEPPTKSPHVNFWNMAAGNDWAPQSNFENMPSHRVTLPRSLVINQPFHKILFAAGLVSSRNEGHRLIVNKGASVGYSSGRTGPMGDKLEFTPIKSWDGSETEKYILEDNALILKVGKWKLKIVEIISDEEFEKRDLNVPGWKEFKEERAAKNSDKEAEPNNGRFSRAI